MNKKEKKQQRFISIKESIIKTLTPRSYTLYSILRLEADYKAECSPITRKVKFISNASNMPVSQVYKCLNELELLGLIKRNSIIGEQTTYLVAQTLHYFSAETSLKMLEGGLSNTEGGLSNTDTLYNSLSRALKDSPQEIKNARADRAIFFTRDADDFSFSKFWDSYPLKQGETICRKIWEKKGLTAIVDAIVEKLEEQKKSDAKFLAGYIFSPKNYLQDERWKDDITKPPKDLKTPKANSEAMSEEKKRVLSMSFMEKCAYDMANLKRNTEEKGGLL